MPSFDAVLEPNLVELKNAVDQTSKEIATRFDFKGTSARLEFAEKSAKDRELTLHGDSDFQISQITDILVNKLSKRQLDIRFLDFSAKIEKAGGDKVRQVVKLKTGIDSENAKKIANQVKQSKMKVQAQIQGDAVRITGNKRDDLQAAIQMLKQAITDLPLSFTNFRD